MKTAQAVIISLMFPALPVWADFGMWGSDRPRVVVSSDIGGTDPDDFQSMVHLLLYADRLDLEGIVSSPFGAGRKDDILEVIKHYENDFPNLRSRSHHYPTPDFLRSITKQGETELAPYAGVREPTEGSQWIVKCAHKDDTRPLHVLVWGGLEDLAQALHDAPEILPKLRVYFIGGPNKKWSTNAYQYIADHHKILWIIEANSTYRGWFVGGNQEDEWGNKGFVTKHVKGHGELGEFFATQLGGTIKMGDSPSVTWALTAPADKKKTGWGGRFVRAWDRSAVRFHRLTSREDKMEMFGVLELSLFMGVDVPEEPMASMVVGNQSIPGSVAGDGTINFRFSPKSGGTFDYTIRGNIPDLDGRVGSIDAVPPAPDLVNRPSLEYPNWWTDDPDPRYAEGVHLGAKTVSRWRVAFLQDFAEGLDRCERLDQDVPD